MDVNHRSSGGGVFDERRALAGQLECSPTTAAVAVTLCLVPISGAFYDRGRKFPLKYFLNDGVTLPKIVGMSVLSRKMTFWYTWAMGLSIGMQSDFG